MHFEINPQKMAWVMENFSIHQLTADWNRTNPVYTLVLRHKNKTLGDLVLLTSYSGHGFTWGDETIAKVLWADNETAIVLKG
jgi:hypothetical protein